MKLNKTQALFLSKILFNYVRYEQSSRDTVISDVEDILADLERFLVDGDDDEDDIEDFDDEEDEDEDDEDDVTPPPVHAAEISRNDLHELPAVKGSTTEIEFESDERDVVDLIVNGYAEIERISFVRREHKAISVWSVNENDWTTFEVQKFPKTWIKTLKVNDVYKVIE